MAFLGTFDTNPRSATSQVGKGLLTGLGSAIERMTESKLREIERQRIAQGLQGVGFDEQEAKGISELPADLQNSIVKEQFMADREGRKASAKTVHEVVNAEKAARDNMATLKRIEELDAKGNVQGLGGEILKKVGLGRFRSADTQELEKLTVSFLSNLKNVFGSRPTNFDVQQYLNSVPSLLQSPAGRARVIKNLKVYNEAAQIRGEALREILKENKNRAPGNIDLLIEDRVGNKLDRLNEQLSGSSEKTSFDESFSSLPDPAKYAGQTIKDTQTGQILKSDGRRWVPQKG